MKVKKFSNEKTQSKKSNVPAFLVKNVKDINPMKRSSMELYNSSETSMFERTLSTSNSSIFDLSKSRKKVSVHDFDKIKELGNGKYGRVSLVRDK